MNQVEYDYIAEEYKISKQLSFRKYVEAYTLFKIAGNIRGASVLDLACGEGFYTRKLKRAGASDVLGVDLSPEMIALAEGAEQQSPLGCRYQVRDVAHMSILGRFDMITAMYLLNYARSREELVAFCRAAYWQLKMGGRFLGVNDNPANDPEQYNIYRKYGFIKESPRRDRQEGDPIRYTFFNPDGTEFQFNNYYLHPSTYEEVFAEVGFVDFQWEGPFLARTQQSNPFWLDFMLFPPIIGFSARKK